MANSSLMIIILKRNDVKVFLIAGQRVVNCMQMTIVKWLTKWNLLFHHLTIFGARKMKVLEMGYCWPLLGVIFNKFYPSSFWSQYYRNWDRVLWNQAIWLDVIDKPCDEFKAIRVRIFISYLFNEIGYYWCQTWFELVNSETWVSSHRH